MLGLDGVIVIDESDTTARLVVPDMLPNAALIVEEPDATAVSRPLEPLTLLTIATPVAEEVHVTVAVRSCWVPSE
jgi:hypothetical protein